MHRDVKPADLLLDSAGRLWVTDFGLARMQHGQTNLTMTGQALGTPRYMSPEQALAQRVPIDHRTDVYSLGATLYELLTLRPAFGSENRQELLQQIATQEPTRPRRMERVIPVEMEIIVLKAMEKRPQDRYATAQELADDLRRFLEARPIRARRPTLVERVQKWLRRHPGVAWAAVAVLLVMTVAASLSTAMIQREKLRTQQALTAEAKHRQQAREALDAMTSQLMTDWLSKQESVLPEHKAFLKNALAFYEEFAADTGQDEASRSGVAAAYLRVAILRAKLGLGAAEPACVTACQLYRQLAADFPTVPTYRKFLADSYFEFSSLLSRSGSRLREAEETCRHAVTLRQQLAANFTTVPACRFDLAYAYVQLGYVLEHRDDLKGAEEAYRAALNLRKQLAAEFPTVSLYRREAAGSQIDLATILQKSGRLKEAEQGIRAAVPLYQRAAAESPIAKNRWLLAWTYNRQAHLLRDIGRAKEAEETYRASLAINQQLLAEFPSVLRYRESSASNHNNLACVLIEQGRLDKGIAEFREAIRLKKDYAEAHYNLGNTLRDKGQLEDALIEYREAIRLKKDYAEAHCNLGLLFSQEGRFTEALVHLRRGHELGSRNPRWRFPSVRWLRDCERLAALDSKLPAILSGQKQPADTAERIAVAQLCQRSCKKHYAHAVRFYRDAFAEKPQLMGDLHLRHRYNAASAAALTGCGHGADADNLDIKDRESLLRQALDWLRADLQTSRQVLEKSADKSGPAIAQQLRHWLKDSDFAGVRGDESLARLPESERQEWQQLWEEVEELRRAAAERPTAASSARP